MVASSEASNIKQARKIETIAHRILPEEPAATRLAYRWMSDVGLNKLTYAARSSNSTIAAEYKLLLNAAVIRAETQDKHGRWVADTTYPPKGAPQPQAGRTFARFENCIPFPKKRFEKRPAIPCERGSPPPPRVFYSTFTSSSVDGSEFSEIIIESNQGVTPDQNVGDDPDSLVDQHPSTSNPTAPLVDISDEPLVESIERLHIVETDVLNTSQRSTFGSSLMDWVEGIESTNDFDVLTPHHRDEPLISFSEMDESSQCGGETVDSAPQSPTEEAREAQEDLERFEHCEDLIWLEDGSKAQSASSTGFDNQPSTTFEERNPLEAQDQSLTDMYTDGLVRFGILEESPKELFQTMNQKGGRAITKSTKPAHSPAQDGVNAPWVAASGSRGTQSPTPRERLDSTTPSGSRSRAEVSPQDKLDGHTLTKSPRLVRGRFPIACRSAIIAQEKAENALAV